MLYPSAAVLSRRVLCLSAIVALPAPLSRLFVHRILSAVARRLDAVEPGCVGLDVEQRGTVQNVHAVHMQDVSLAPDQFHDAQRQPLTLRVCPNVEKDAEKSPI